MKRFIQLFVALVLCLGFVPIAIQLNSATHTKQQPLGKAWKLKNTIAGKPDVIYENVTWPVGTNLDKSCEDIEIETKASKILSNGAPDCPVGWFLRVEATYETLTEEIQAVRGVKGASYPNSTPTFKGVSATEWKPMLAAFKGPKSKNPYWNDNTAALGHWKVQAHVWRNVTHEVWINTDEGHLGETTTTIRKGPPLTCRTWTWIPISKL